MAEPRIPTVQTEKLLVHFDVHHCELSQDELDRLAADLDLLSRSVEHFPQRDLRVLIEFNSRTTDYSVKVSLLLPGKTLVASDHNSVLHAAYEKCLAILQENVKAYKDQLGQVSERQKQEKGTHQELVPFTPVDTAALDAAADAGDYPAFRAALAPYEDGLRLRAGRWVERYPEVQAHMGRDMDVADVVEEVFLMAFEGHAARPRDIRYGNWLENLLDPAVRALAHHPEEELQNISMARSAAGAPPGPDGVSPSTPPRRRRAP